MAGYIHCLNFKSLTNSMLTRGVAQICVYKFVLGANRAIFCRENTLLNDIFSTCHENFIAFKPVIYL